METVLLLDNTRVFPDGSQVIKLTKENPYFTQSDSYTLDVSLPMDIYANLVFFKNINRQERRKKSNRMNCRLIVDSRLLLSGSAKITQVTEKEVKVQLLGGNSEINMLSESEKFRIDNLSLGQTIVELVEEGGEGSFGGRRRYYVDTGVVDTGVGCKDSYVHDETNDVYKKCHQFSLIGVFKQIMKVLGYEVTRCDIDVSPWNEIFIANANTTRKVASTLPRWTPKEFVGEFCNFFNVSVLVNQNYKTVSVISNHSLYNSSDFVTIQPVEEYTVEMNDEPNAHSLADDKISYDMSGSEHHDYDVIPDNVREMAPREDFASLSAAVNAYSSSSNAEKTGKIYACPIGLFTGWFHDYSDVGQQDKVLEFTQIDALGPLERASGGGSETQLKICPVAIAELKHERGGIDGQVITWEGHIPSLENPRGNDLPGYYIGDGQGLHSLSQQGESPEDETVSIQDYITGEKDLGKAEKEDRIQVMFIDDVLQPWRSDAGNGHRSEGIMPAGFTDYLYKKAHGGNNHSSWSMSLNPCQATHYLGQLHNQGWHFNMKAKTCFKFHAKEMPDPTKIFIINNKRYGCEKIEANITALGMNDLMTGYFYESIE